MTDWWLGILSVVVAGSAISMMRHLSNKIETINSLANQLGNLTKQLDGAVQAAYLEPRLAEITYQARKGKEKQAELADRVSKIEGRLDI